MTPKQIIAILQSQIEAAEEENNKLRDVNAELVKAAEAVLSHRIGSLPNRGWLQDNDASRKALADLAAALAAAEPH